MRLDDPILNLSQVRSGVGTPIRLLRAVFCFYCPEVDFPQPGGDWPQGRCDASGQFVPSLLDTLVDQLAREIDVGSVLEDDGHLRQSIPRKRPGLFQVRQAGHDRLDRVRDPLLRLQRRVTRCLRVDLNLYVRDVGDSVDGQLLIAENAERSHREGRKQHQPSLFD